MEMPIWAIMTLFIATVMGAMILMFGSQWMGRAGDDIGEVLPEDKEDRFIRQATISNNQVANMIEACYNGSKGEALGDAMCFSVTLENRVSIDGNAISPLVGLDANSFSIMDNKTSSFSVIWNFVKGIVEVRT